MQTTKFKVCSLLKVRRGCRGICHLFRDGSLLGLFRSAQDGGGMLIRIVRRLSRDDTVHEVT
jgi:hypothetical protein